MQRLLQSFLEKFDRLPREQCGNHRQGNAKAENGCPCKHQKQANGIQFSGNQSRKPHTEIRKPAEQYGQRDLQQLYQFKLLSENENLPQNQNAVPENQPSTEGQYGKFQTDYIGHGRNRRHPAPPRLVTATPSPEKNSPMMNNTYRFTVSLCNLTNHTTSDCAILTGEYLYLNGYTEQMQSEIS